MKHRSFLLLFSFLLISQLTTGIAFAKQQNWADQGWSEEDRYEWYRGTQGSRLIPYTWFTALEQADSEKAFADPDFLKSFNFLYPEPGSKAAELELPIGFVIDKQDDTHFIASKLRWKNKQKKDEPWVGMNCSACHTGQVQYKDLSLTIDGAPGLIDFQSFVEQFDEALKKTSEDQDKFNRFAKKVLGHTPTQKEASKIKDALEHLVKWQETTARLDYTHNRYGYGRIDAFGHIFNKTVLFANLDSKNYEESLDNMVGNPSDAPVSLPFLWGIQDQNQVQWNGIVENIVISNKDSKIRKFFHAKEREIEIGAIGRNSGEVLGVFGEAVIDKKTFTNFDKPLDALFSKGFKSSVKVQSLNGLEAKLKALEPPKWPQAFPELDAYKIKAGKELFASQGCNSCHTPTAAEIAQGEKKTDCRNSYGALVPNEKGTECMDHFFPPPSGQVASDIRKALEPSATDADIDHALKSYTDIMMACNAINYEANTGKLKGITINGSELGDRALVATMLTTTVKGVIFGNKLEVLDTAFHDKVEINMPLLASGRSKIPSKVRDCLVQINDLIESNGCKNNPDDVKICQRPHQLLAYKARPLDGIWATAPYLHNGSVPSLFDLLLPVDERPTEFWVGSQEFDPKKVGYVSTKPENGQASQMITTVDGIFSAGNSNYGHDYNNAKLTDEERWALVEYMKSL